MGIRLGLAAIVILGLSVSACSQMADAPVWAKGAKVERVAGTEVNRVTLSPKAVERLGIKTAAVADERLGNGKRLARGEVVGRPRAAAADKSDVWVRVPLSAQDLATVAAGQPASVLPLSPGAGGNAGTPARAVKADVKGALHYALDSPNGLTPGQQVRVEVPLAGTGKGRVVPYSAVLYDARGKTWVYTNPEPLVFVRQPISIDHIEGDRAVLSDGPPAGTAVVVVGAAELFGAENGK